VEAARARSRSVSADTAPGRPRPHPSGGRPGAVWGPRPVGSGWRDPPG